MIHDAVGSCHTTFGSRFTAVTRGRTGFPSYFTSVRPRSLLAAMHCTASFPRYGFVAV